MSVEIYGRYWLIFGTYTVKRYGRSLVIVFGTDPPGGPYRVEYLKFIHFAFPSVHAVRRVRIRARPKIPVIGDEG